MANQCEPENLCSELVSVLYEDRSRDTRSMIANLEKISSNYAVLLSDERLHAGWPVAFNAHGHDLYGTVESVEMDDVLGCFAKVKLDATSRWNGRVFVPEHFLALCALPQDDDLEVGVAPSPRAYTLGNGSGS